MATKRAIIHVYDQIHGRLQYQQNPTLAQELADFCEEILLQLPEAERWNVRTFREAERWVVIREGADDTKTVIAKAKGTLNRKGKFLVGPSEWAGYMYEPGEHFDTAEEAEHTAIAARSRRIADFQHRAKHAAEQLDEAKANQVEVSDKIWKYGEWDG